MHWSQILGVVVLAVLAAAVFRTKPNETRTIMNTRLMKAAGVVLMLLILLLLAWSFFGR